MHIELKRTEPKGNIDPKKVCRFANGKRVTRERFDDLKQIAQRLDCFLTVTRRGRLIQYCHANSPV